MKINQLSIGLSIALLLLITHIPPGTVEASQVDDPTPKHFDMWAFNTNQDGGRLTADVDTTGEESLARSGSPYAQTSVHYYSYPLSNDVGLSNSSVHIILHLERSCALGCNSVDAVVDLGGLGRFQQEMTQLDTSRLEVTIEIGDNLTTLPKGTSIRLEFHWRLKTGVTAERVYGGANETGLSFDVNSYGILIKNDELGISLAGKVASFLGVIFLVLIAGIIGLEIGFRMSIRNRPIPSWFPKDGENAVFEAPFSAGE